MVPESGEGKKTRLLNCNAHAQKIYFPVSMVTAVVTHIFNEAEVPGLDNRGSILQSTSVLCDVNVSLSWLMVSICASSRYHAGSEPGIEANPISESLESTFKLMCLNFNPTSIYKNSFVTKSFLLNYSQYSKPSLLAKTG